MEDEVPINDAEISSNLIGLNKGITKEKKKLIIISGSVFFAIIIAVILLIILAGSKGKKEKKILGVINCSYDVKSATRGTILLSNEYNNKNSDFDIEIHGNIIKYSKQYIFNNTGQNNVKFILYGPINMDFMFKDVPDIVSIEMLSENNLEITSMISSFENCQS